MHLCMFLGDSKLFRAVCNKFEPLDSKNSQHTWEKEAWKKKKEIISNFTQTGGGNFFIPENYSAICISGSCSMTSVSCLWSLNRFS